MLFVNKINTDIIEVEDRQEQGFSSPTRRYMYFDIKNMVRLWFKDTKEKTGYELTHFTSKEKCYDDLVNRIKTVYIPLMQEQEQQREETRIRVEKENEHITYHRKMEAEYAKLTNQWWNERHTFDKYNRCQYQSDKIEIQLEKEHSVFSSVTKLELLRKYYGVDHVYATEFAKNLIKNNPLYRKHIGME